MHRTWRLALVAAIVALGGVVGAAPTSAAAVNSITVAKKVVGTPPSGTTFTVSLNCGEPVDIKFDATGTATTTATFHPAASTQCTVNETDNGGATTVAYACANTTPSDTQVTCATNGQSVEFGDTNTGAATLTVTNTFEPPTTTTTTQPPQQTQAAPAAVTASPNFTG
jgi:hypothetical protein